MKFYKDSNRYFYWRKIISNKLNAIYINITINIIVFFKNGENHNSKNASYFNYNGFKEFSLNGKIYGYEKDFTKLSWRKFTKLQAFL